MFLDRLALDRAANGAHSHPNKDRAIAAWPVKRPMRIAKSIPRSIIWPFTHILLIRSDLFAPSKLRPPFKVCFKFGLFPGGLAGFRFE